MQRAAQEYERWFAYAQTNPALLKILTQIAADDALVTDCFYTDLQFGTGGLRGEMGAGTNRMNIYTVGKATQGLAHYLLQTVSKTPSACIAYDTRNLSLEFAQTAASVLCANGVKTYLFSNPHPTPMLSFALRHLHADCGIVITASHNPCEYNGYKIYNHQGGQITDTAADAISKCIAKCDIFEDVQLLPLETALANSSLEILDTQIDEAYYAKVKDLILRKSMVRTGAAELSIIYTPLHGSGNIPVRRVLRDLGFCDVSTVPEQELPDGDFPTVPYPNPEENAVFELALQQAQESNPDLIIATDPDCDRIGVLAKNMQDTYTALSGNQIGALLCDYIISTLRELDAMPPNPAVLKTIVSTTLVNAICERQGVAVCDVLTGFKYIGETVSRWEADGSHSFLFGFEESCGYLAGNFVRDKDAVIAAALVAEMALYYKKNGKTLCTALQVLQEQYGWAEESLLCVTLAGADGQERIARFMDLLHREYAAIFATEQPLAVEDYRSGVRRLLNSGEEQRLNLPSSNVLKFIFADGAWLVLRPSGTEPKIKLYLSAVGESCGAAKERMAQLQVLAQRLLAEERTRFPQ